ncbi:MAG TPA: lysophospholipid acyltransferase family protein, partial [Acidimicrobiales bacterium]|nr:lysophospholipid acyltransferase family protein [Acidimicrobiales bacterium]
MAENGKPGPSTLGHAPSSRIALVWYAFARAVVELVCRLYWRVEIRGRENVPSGGPFVIAPVHRSNIDTLLAGCVTRRRIRFMGKDSLWKYRWSGALFSSLGAFPVHRGTPDREALRICEEALRGGEPVVLFPEGTRQSGPDVQPLFEGAAFVAARANVPIVPVGIGGSEWAMPKGSKRIMPVKVVINIGEPIPAPDRPESGRVSRRAVAETSERLHSVLQGLFDEALAAAGRA